MELTDTIGSDGGMSIYTITQAMSLSNSKIIAITRQRYLFHISEGLFVWITTIM